MVNTHRLPLAQALDKWWGVQRASRVGGPAPMARRDDRERRAMFERGAAPPAPGSPRRQPRWGEAGMHRRPNAAGPSPRAASGGGGSAALVVIAAWTLFAFAGAYAWTTVPLVCGAVALAIRERPPIGRGSRILDGMLIVW